MRAPVFLLPLLTSLLVFSCDSESQSGEDKKQELRLQDSTAIIMDETPNVTVQQIDSMLTGFPKYWVEIKKRGSDFVYTEYCNGTHPYLELIRKDDHWEIFTAYGEDGEAWQVLDMRTNSQLAYGQQLMDGQFIVKKLTYPDDEIYTASFFWNKTAKTCTFGDFFNPEIFFIDVSLKDTFVIEEEECNV